MLCGRPGRGNCPGLETALRARPDLLAGEDLPPEPLQRRSLDNRARLKAAALSLFGEKGYEGASIDEIAGRANLAVGGFYLHFRSKRQLLLVLMDDLLEGLSQLDLHPTSMTDVRAGIRKLLYVAFSHDLRYLGACRAWQEAVLSDPDLARKQQKIQTWSTARVTMMFRLLQQLPNARPGVDVPGLASVMDNFFWSLLSQAARFSKADMNQRIDSATHLIYHALFTDPPGKK